MAETYGRAAAALKQRDFRAASEAFVTLRDDPRVMEPTGSWAACEAVIVELLDGRGDAARRAARRGVKRIEAAQGLDPALRDALREALGRVSRFEPMEAGEGELPRGGHYLVAMLGGLKNWEQGMADEAEPLLKMVAESSPEQAGAWLKPYTDLSRDYLADLSRLRAAEPPSFDLGVAEAQATVDALEALHGELLTRGRARFSVRSWQLELAKVIRQGGREAPDLEEALPGAWREMRFADAVSLLKRWQPGGDDGTEKRRVMILLSEAADAFLA